MCLAIIPSIKGSLIVLPLNAIIAKISKNTFSKTKIIVLNQLIRPIESVIANGIHCKKKLINANKSNTKPKKKFTNVNNNTIKTALSVLALSHKSSSLYKMKATNNINGNVKM